MGILLVDDDPEVQSLVESTLHQSGLSVISVNDGLSALDLAISETPDLILADSLIQGIDIATFVKKIHRRASLADTPIVLLQGASDADPLALQLLEVHAILKKPLDPILLSKEVKKQLGIVDADSTVEDVSSFLPITDDFLSEEPATFEAVDKDESPFHLPDLLEPEQPVLHESPKSPSPVLAHTEKTATKTDIDSEKVDEAIRKIVLEVVERVAWEIIPGVIETAMPNDKIKSLVEQVVWEIVPPLAEIEIKKEIKRLQPDAGFTPA